MSKETLLQKEFTEKDVNRIRNLVNKKFGDSIQTQVGYSKKHIERKEGEIWEENGKQWNIKNGIKISISKLKKAKTYNHIPFICPTCNGPIRNEYDKKMFHIHGTCFDCVTKMETKLKIEGNYEKYENKIVKNNALFMLDEFEKGFNNFLEISEGIYFLIFS